MLRAELQVAEGELRDRCWSPPLALQHWLQLTHELENRTYTKKKQAAERQLQQAREACEKLRKKRTSLVGAFVSTHGKSIDDVDRSIVEARTSLNEVTQELQERVYRWKQIELLTGLTVVNNNGLHWLEGVLYRGNPARLKGSITKFLFSFFVLFSDVVLQGEAVKMIWMMTLVLFTLPLVQVRLLMMSTLVILLNNSFSLYFFLKELS